MLYEEKIKDLKERIKQYQKQNSFSICSPVFHDKFDREYQIGCYRKDGAFYLRVSTALCCLMTPDLQAWSAKTSEAKQTKVKAQGSAVGGAIHALAESYFKGNEITEDVIKTTTSFYCKKESIEQTDEILQEVKLGYQAFLSLKEKTGMKFIASEVTLHSEKLHCAGTLDLIVGMDQRIHIIDFKSGFEKSGAKIRATQSAYKFFFEEQFGEPVVCTIFALQKDSGRGWHFTYRNYAMSFRVFLGQLATVADHWYKELPTFWPHWNKDFSNIKHRSWK